MTRELAFYLRDDDRVVVASVVPSSFQLTLRHRGVSSWTAQMSGDQAALVEVAESTGLVVTLGGSALMSGSFEWAADMWDAAGWSLELFGRSDEDLVLGEIAYPEVDAHPGSWATDEADIRTDLPSTLMLGYMYDNLGLGALSNRQRPGLVMGSDPLAGTSMTVRARCQYLSELLATICQESGADLGWTIRQELGSTDRTFDVVVPNDLTGEIIFSASLGSLVRARLQVAKPAATVAILAGQGEGVAREFVEVEESTGLAAHGRRVLYRDARDVDNTPELEQRADGLLMAARRTTGLEVVPAEGGRWAYGVDYALGDRVSVDLRGDRVAAIIEEVHIVWAPGEGVAITPVVGGLRPERPGIYDRLDDLAASLGLLTRR